MEINLRDDIRLLQNARKNSFIKNQDYTVGAIINAKSGRKYTGCNIEINSSETVCAEIVALLKAISEGETEFYYMAIMGGKKNQDSEKILPCESCKKILNNFVDKDFKIYIIYENKIEEHNFSELFHKEN